MTAEAERTKAFCTRTITYDLQYREYLAAEQMLTEELAQETGIMANQAARKTLSEIQAGKKIAREKLTQARQQVDVLIEAADLPPRLRAILFWRYHQCLVWSVIDRRMKLTKRYVWELHVKALEMAAPRMKELYPEWKPEE